MPGKEETILEQNFFHKKKTWQKNWQKKYDKNNHANVHQYDVMIIKYVCNSQSVTMATVGIATFIYTRKVIL